MRPSAVHCLIFGELFCDAIDIRRMDVYNKIVMGCSVGGI